MTKTKSKDNSKKVIESHENSEDDYGLLEVFRADSIPGHNKSIQMLVSVLEDENHVITDLKSNYGNGPGVNIFTRGTSGTEYKIEVFSNQDILRAFDNKMSNIDNDDSQIITILSTFCPLIITFKIYAFNPVDDSYSSICIEPSDMVDFGESTAMPHRLDLVVSLVLALTDDLNTAKLEKMDTLRRSLLRNWKSVWLLGKNTCLNEINDFVKTGIELLDIHNGA